MTLRKPKWPLNGVLHWLSCLDIIGKTFYFGHLLKGILIDVEFDLGEIDPVLVTDIHVHVFGNTC